jgi:anaerobic selenocysteine-containing dehydrogenase
MKQKNNKKSKSTYFNTTCRMCGNLCGITVEVSDNKVISIKGDQYNRGNKGRICIKGSLAPEAIYSEKRLINPLRKNEHGAFKEITMEEAMDEITEKLSQIIEKYSSESVGVWKGEGIDFMQQEDLAKRFIYSINSPNYFSNDSQCFSGRLIAHKLMYGDYLIPDLENSSLIISWGSNSPMSHSTMMQQINIGREKGAKLIVIDTKYTELSRVSDLFIKIKPGADIYLAYYLIKKIIEDKYFDKDFVENHTLGIEELYNYVSKFSLDEVIAKTGIEENQILQIYQMILEGKRSICSVGGTGLEHQINGVNSLRAITIIDALVGAIDRKGGMLVPHGLKLNNLTLFNENRRWKFEPIGSKEFPILFSIRKECHTPTLMNQIITEKPYPFKALLLTAANPVLTNANSKKVVDAFKALDLLVVKDLYLTETAQLADYVIPAASYLEREEIFVNTYNQTIHLTSKCVDLGLQTEYEFFKGIAEKLGAEKYFPWKSDEELNHWLLEPSGISVEDLRLNSSGLEYESRTYFGYKNGEMFNTPSGKVEFSSELLKRYNLEGIPVAKDFQFVDEYFDLVMSTGARKQIFVNSKTDKSEKLSLVMPNAYLEIHPIDAKKRNISDGDRVLIKSRVGHFETCVKILSEKEIQEGYVQHLHGFSKENVNLVTYDDVFDIISGFPPLKYTAVHIEKINNF